MKDRILFLTCMLLFSIQSYAQICSSNPGGDQGICFGEQMTLQGESSTLYLQPLEANWMANPSNPAPTVIVDPNALVTDVNSTTEDELPKGDYEFTLCVVCVDHEIACQSVIVTIGEIENPPVIDPHDDIICGGDITFTGTDVDPGVTPNWVISPPFNGIFEDNGTSLNLTHSGSAPCTYEIFYTHTIGGCVEVNKTEITFIREYPNVNATVIEPISCPACTNEIRLLGTFAGCGGTPIWTLDTWPAGVDPTEVFIESPNNYFTDVNLPANGDYCFSYTIENGDCTSDVDNVCCEINVLPGFGLGPDEWYVNCQDVWDLEELLLEVDEYPGATYEWSMVTSSIVDHGIEFESPNSASTNVIFNNSPYDIELEGWYFVIRIIMTSGECIDIKDYRFLINPTVTLHVNELNLLCGGDPQFNLRDYYKVTNPLGLPAAQVLSSPTLPLGSISANDNLDLTAEGMHCFEIRFTQTGTDPYTGVSVTCSDTDTLCVFVANVPTIDCGSPIVTCLLSTQLNGNMPTDVDGNPLDIPVYWEQIGTNNVTIINADSEDPFITDMNYGETYTFRYVISDTEDCVIACENTVTVLSENECEPCDVSVEVGPCKNGCIEVQLSGADDYLWQPNTGVDNTDPENPIICNEEGGEYQVFGFVDGVICGTAIVTVPPCVITDPTPTCAFSLERACTTCACGLPYGGARLLDAEGNFFHPDDLNVNVEWFIDDVSQGTQANPFYLEYDDPYVVCAYVYIEQDGAIACDTTMCVDVTCHGDCPQFSFATCADMEFAGEPECVDYDPAYACAFGGYGGWVWALDLAGNVVTQGNIDWYDDNFVDPNPVFLWPNAQTDACSGIPYSSFSWEHGCDGVKYYETDCCNLNSPTITCYGQSLDGWLIGYQSLCPSSSFQFTVSCVNGEFYEVYEVTPGTIGEHTFTLPNTWDCSWVAVSMSVICADGSIGAPSNCIWYFRSQDQCLEMNETCDELFDNSHSGGDGKEGRMSANASSDLGQRMLYPNPSVDGNFILQLSPRHLTKIDLSLRLYTTAGQLLYSRDLITGQTTYEIKANLNAGMYLVSIEDATGAVIDSERLIVSK